MTNLTNEEQEIITKLERAGFAIVQPYASLPGEENEVMQ